MDTLQQIEAIREEALIWIIDEKMFTSVDIANSLKQRGTWIRNRDVASYLRDNVVLLSMKVNHPHRYIMSVINVTLPNGSNAEATLYHPEDTDPSEYEKADRRVLTPDEAQNDSPFDDGDGTELDGPGCCGGDDKRFIGMMAERLHPFKPSPSQIINIDYVETLVINIGTDFEMDVDDDY